MQTYSGTSSSTATKWCVLSLTAAILASNEVGVQAQPTGGQDPYDGYPDTTSNGPIGSFEYEDIDEYGFQEGPVDTALYDEYGNVYDGTEHPNNHYPAYDEATM